MGSFNNSSLLFVPHRPSNYTAEKTLYEQCIDMPAVIIWYLCLQFINMFLGIPANLRVLWLITKNKCNSSTSDIFAFHLAIVDVLFCFIFPLELVNTVFITNSNIWYIQLFFYSLKDFSPLFLLCICLDCYMAVVHPITFTELKDRQHRTVLVIIVWLTTLAYAAVKCVGHIVDIDKLFIGVSFIVFALMVYCNIAILWVLKESGPGRDEMHPVKKRAFNSVLILLVIILFSCIPGAALIPFEDYFSPKVFDCYIGFLAFGFMNISSTTQPILYLSKKKLPWRLNCCQSRITKTQ
ncbi:proteinase-activated receptor 3-like [Pholidichthys leucotaenia]